MNYKALFQHLSDSAAVTGIVSTRIYHDAPPVDPTTPYLVFHEITNGEASRVEYGTSRYQIDLVGQLRPSNQSETLNNLKDEIIDLLKDFRGTLGSGANTQIIKGTEYAGATKLLLGDNEGKQLSLDFLFHYLRS